MLKRLFLSITLTALFLSHAVASEKISIILDWYLNPDHAPLIVAQQIGSFKELGLDVELITPSDPTMAPRLVAAKQADLAISYQQQLYIYSEEGLALTRIGTLVETPLNTIMALPDSGIKSPADLKGKKIGFSVSGIEEALLQTVLQQGGVRLDEVTLINVNFNLVSALLSKQVDAVIGGYRNVEANELREQGISPIIMKIEDYGVPTYDELIILAHKDMAKSEKFRKFLQGLAKGVEYLRAHPEQTWDAFAKAYPELDNAVNKDIWFETIPLFSQNPGKLDRERYINYGKFLYEHKLITHEPKLDDYAIELK